MTKKDTPGTGEPAPEAARPGERLKQCAAACEEYAERVFAALHETPADDR